MPGVRDRNLRSGDLHEELGVFLLKAIGLVAAIPRQEDVGHDAFVTLIRPEGSRRLIPDLSFLVQLKAGSVPSVGYDTSDAVNWVSSLDTPLFIGRVFLENARIELFSTQRLHQIVLETTYRAIELLLDPADESPHTPNVRRANLGPPVHSWSVSNVSEPDFLARSFAVLRPHVESLRRNRQLRGIQSQNLLAWETGQPPTENARMTLVSPGSAIADTLRDMTPHVLRLLTELQFGKRYADFPIILSFMDMMTRWGVDPDPGGVSRWVAGCRAEGPEITIEDVIRIRYAFRLNHLDLSQLPVTDDALAAVPDDVDKLVLADTPVTDAGIPALLRLAGLKRLNLAGTQITDVGMNALAALANLEWLCVNRASVTDEGLAKLKQSRPDMEVITWQEP